MFVSPLATPKWIAYRQMCPKEKQDSTIKFHSVPRHGLQTDARVAVAGDAEKEKDNTKPDSIDIHQDFISCVVKAENLIRSKDELTDTGVEA